MSSPVGSGCSPDYFSEDIFSPIDPHEDPAGHWTQSGPLAQDADPFGFLNQEGLREMSSGSMPQMASEFSVLDNGFLRVTAIDPHPQTIDPACLNLSTSADCGLDLSSATSHEVFQAPTPSAGSQGAHPPL
ncbi:hypothetical protein CDV36_000454 [Fusarium kuroshium]|uniref:Uncharacterized protein n=1 Tax=Fusarium kuroshium TaxID=2010991 RepID=A0A3M2SQF7_9HYPO|nr:hypothetical protein CDV36_000454 [Fusarium kuroshium]